MSDLLAKQQLFAKLLGQLLDWIHTHPTWAVTLGDGNAHDGHMANSLHYIRLAQDLNLFVEGVYVTGAHPAWDEIGAKWKTLNVLARWGGDFESLDLNHISLAHEGRQ